MAGSAPPVIRLLPCLLIPLLPLAPAAEDSPLRLLKVLRHALDHRGRHALSPSLFDRDAYQAHLRRHPELIGGMAFDVQWKGSRAIPEGTELEVQVRHGSEEGMRIFSRRVPLEREGRRRRGWQRLAVAGEEYRRWGSILAWQVRLLDGARELSRQRSFLWPADADPG